MPMSTMSKYEQHALREIHANVTVTVPSDNEEEEEG